MVGTADQAEKVSGIPSPPSSTLPAARWPSRAAQLRRRHALGVMLAVLSMVGTQGCEALGLTLFGVGAGVSAGTGVSHILDSVAYKTFSRPVDTLQDATLRTLEGMDIQVTDIEVMENQSTESGRKIVAVARDRTIKIELDRLTAKVTRMRVDVQRGTFFRDSATATEIIAQTERTLGEASVGSRTADRKRGRRQP